MVHLVTDSPSTTHAALDGTTVRRWIRESADVFSSQRDYLTQLDAAIGDADHGINMDRGFSAAVVDLDAVDGSHAGRTVDARRLHPGLPRRWRGGPAVRWLLPPGGQRARHHRDLRRRGPAARRSARASTRSKAWVPRSRATRRSSTRSCRPCRHSSGTCARDATLGQAAHRAAEAAKEGRASTIPMQARKGRASYLGPRSVGHQDPGATSTALLFAALAKVGRETREP